MPGSTALSEGAKGAYAHILALAADEPAFLEIVRAEMAALDLFVVEAGDIALVSEYDRQGRVHGVIAKLNGLLSAENPVQYRDFDTYPHDDA